MTNGDWYLTCFLHPFPFLFSLQVLLLMQHGADVRDRTASSPYRRNCTPSSSHSITLHESSHQYHPHQPSPPSTTSHSLLKMSLLSRDLVTTTLLYAAGASLNPEDPEERVAVSELMVQTHHSPSDCAVFKRFLVCFLCSRWVGLVWWFLVSCFYVKFFISGNCFDKS